MEFVAASAAQGIPEDVAHGLAALFEEVLDGRNTATTDGVERALGRPARSFEAYVACAARVGAWGR